MKVSHSESSKVLQVELIKEVSPSHGIGHVGQRPSRGFTEIQTAERWSLCSTSTAATTHLKAASHD